MGFKRELEGVLEGFDKKIYDVVEENREHKKLNSKIDELIEKSGYTKIENKKRVWEYWTKPSSIDDLTDVFIRTHYKSFWEKWDLSHKRPTWIWYHYQFAKVKNDKLEEFCKRYEIEDIVTIDHNHKGFFRHPLFFYTLFVYGNSKKLRNCYEGEILEDKEAIEAAFRGKK